MVNELQERQRCASKRAREPERRDKTQSGYGARERDVEREATTLCLQQFSNSLPLTAQFMFVIHMKTMGDLSEGGTIYARGRKKGLNVLRW